MIVCEAALRLNTKNFDVQKHLSNRKKTLQQLTTFLAHFKHNDWQSKREGTVIPILRNMLAIMAGFPLKALRNSLFAVSVNSGTEAMQLPFFG